MDLGTTIARLRIQQGLSQGDLAEALEVSRQSVSKWETNASTPDLDKLVKLSRFFGVTLDELVTGDTPPQSESSVEQPPSCPLQQEVPPSHIRSGQRTAAIILLCMGFLVWLLLTLLGGPLQGVFLAAPFLACAAICFWTKKRAGLWCAWTVYLAVELYLRWATSLTWTLTLHTFSFTQGGNYLRLIISWVQLLVLLLMLFLTLRSFRNVKIDLKRRRIQVLLGGGWILLALLRLLRSPLYSLLYRYPATDFNTGAKPAAADRRCSFTGTICSPADRHGLRLSKKVRIKNRPSRACFFTFVQLLTESGGPLRSYTACRRASQHRPAGHGRFPFLLGPYPPSPKQRRP